MKVWVKRLSKSIDWFCGVSTKDVSELVRNHADAVKQSLLLSDGPQSTTSFTMAPSENYYATTDLIHVSRPSSVTHFTAIPV